MFLEEILVRKKNGTLEPYNADKLLEAVNQSSARARLDLVDGIRESSKLTDDEEGKFLSIIENKLMRRSNNVITTAALHSMVEKALQEVAPDVGTAYSNYHSFRISLSNMMSKIMGRCSMLLSTRSDDEALTAKNQNANASSEIASTKKAFFGDYTAEEYLENFFLKADEKQAAEDGYIYIHDKNARMIYPFNCCLFNVGYVLEHGCNVNGVVYNKPKTLDKMFDVLGDLILMNSSQQYGGFTVPRIDSIVVPYAKMSYEKYLDKYISLGIDKEQAAMQAEKDVTTDMYDGFQGLEVKLNTVASSRGDFPFTTITFGIEKDKWGQIASIAALETRMNGQGEKGKKKPVLFPKLVFLYDENLHGKGKMLSHVFDAAISCSEKSMYPDYLSLTGEGYIASMYKKYGEKGVISPMGCRAFLSPWYERGGMEPADENDIPVYEGRFNIGAVSLNLPMILAKAQHDNTDFYHELDYYLEMIRNFHLRTYAYLGKLEASINPVAFCYGGLYGGHLKPTDKIAPLLDSATASFGITALNELQQQYNGKSIYEDGEFCLEVMKHINEKLAEFKKEDHRLYAVYGTPAENLCGKQIKQYRMKYGIVDGVSDREYVSNSFHCHVTEHISPIQKQDSEYRFWEYFNGGKIQYCRYNLGYNRGAIETIVRRAMQMGLYEGVNLSLDYCDDCGYQQVEMGIRCPKCGSVHITQIDRMNGYLGYTRVGNNAEIRKDNYGNEYIVIKSRYSPHKQKEISERISM